MFRPILIIFKGLPGTGKTTLARKLEQELRWNQINRDDIKEQLLDEKGDMPDLGRQSYDIMWDTLEKNLADGKSIICDTNINHPLALQHFSRIQQNTNARIVVLECFCRDEEEHRRRLDSRKQMNLSSFWIDSWEKYQEYLKSDDNQGDYEIPYQVIRIDTSQPIELPELVAQIFQDEG